MKKTTIIIIPILLCCVSVFAQEEQERKWAVKAYVNGTFYTLHTSTTNAMGNVETYNYSERNIGRVSPAITYSKGRFAQELELSKFRIKKTEDLVFIDLVGQNITVPTSGARTQNTEIGLRYLASAIFRPFKTKELSLGIGTSVQPYFNHLKMTPSTSTTFPFKTYDLGAEISAVPQVEYDFYKRFFINLSFPIELFDFSIHSSKLENPSLSSSESSSKEVNAVFLPKQYHLRAGIGVRF